MKGGLYILGTVSSKEQQDPSPFFFLYLLMPAMILALLLGHRLLTTGPIPHGLEPQLAFLSVAALPLSSPFAVL